MKPKDLEKAIRDSVDIGYSENKELWHECQGKEYSEALDRKYRFKSWIFNLILAFFFSQYLPRSIVSTQRKLFLELKGRTPNTQLGLSNHSSGEISSVNDEEGEIMIGGPQWSAAGRADINFI